MFFEDLSEYSYDLPRSLPGVLNVGWLSQSHPFRTGETSSTFLERLRRGAAEFSINRMRGYHSCEFCQAPMDPMLTITIDSKEIYLGHAELWLRAPDGTILAAPNLIVHYVEAHHYLPPSAFIAALERTDRVPDWVSEHERAARTRVLYL